LKFKTNIVADSVANPDPVGSVSFGRIWVWNFRRRNGSVSDLLPWKIRNFHIYFLELLTNTTSNGAKIWRMRIALHQWCPGKIYWFF
jgi:hypothetical protein